MNQKNLINLLKILKNKPLDVKLPEISEDDMADIIFTSGTTGNLKELYLHIYKILKYLTIGLRILV
jgi:long-subunit acyl-CoA synthetase (AMP-forming)